MLETLFGVLIVPTVVRLQLGCTAVGPLVVSAKVLMLGPPVISIGGLLVGSTVAVLLVGSASVGLLVGYIMARPQVGAVAAEL